MAAAPEPRPLPRHPRVWWSRIAYRWPFVIWLAAVAACAFLYLHSGQTAAVSGVIEVQREEAAPIEAARLLKVHVVPGQAVKAGDLLAEFDASVLDAEMHEIQAQFALDQLQTERQFTRAITEADARLQDLKLKQALDANRLEALQGQLKDMDKVADASLDTARGYALYRAELDTLTRNAALYPLSLAALEAEAKNARAQLEQARKAGAPEVLHSLLASLEQRKLSYTLRARQPGIVSRVLHFAGDVIPEATPVVSIVVENSQQVLAFVPEWMSHDILPGREAWLTRPMRSGDAVLAHVVVLGPEILALPTRVSPIQGQTLRGRRVVLDLESPADFLPGESVNIHFTKPWWMDRYQALLERYTRKAPAAAPGAS